jgi:hypothetical protein
VGLCPCVFPNTPLRHAPSVGVGKLRFKSTPWALPRRGGCISRPSGIERWHKAPMHRVRRVAWRGLSQSYPLDRHRGGRQLVPMNAANHQNAQLGVHGAHIPLKQWSPLHRVDAAALQLAGITDRLANIGQATQKRRTRRQTRRVRAYPHSLRRIGISTTCGALVGSAAAKKSVVQENDFHRAGCARHRDTPQSACLTTLACHQLIR